MNMNMNVNININININNNINSNSNSNVLAQNVQPLPWGYSIWVSFFMDSDQRVIEGEPCACK